jgi:hypothetical protein
MNSKAKRYHRYRFPPQIISHAVWLYHRFSLSFRDVEELLAKRGRNGDIRVTAPSKNGVRLRLPEQIQPPQASTSPENH